MNISKSCRFSGESLYIFIAFAVREPPVYIIFPFAAQESNHLISADFRMNRVITRLCDA